VQDRQRDRLEQELKAVESQHSLWTEKLSRLSKAKAIETDPATSFKLEQQIEEAEAEIDRLKLKIQSLEEQLHLISIDRRKFIKWIGFGGTGTVLVFVLPKIRSPIPELPPTRPLRSIPSLSTIEFVSVQLNDNGDIVDRTKGQAQIYTEELGNTSNTISLRMVKISPGQFLMGSEGEEGSFDAESPQHQVKVADFFIGQTLVTQAQWQQIMGNNPSEYKGNEKLPVESISWQDANQFCQKLSQQTQRKYRLPTEAEWEYACRARTTTPFHFGNTISSEVANYRAQDWNDNGKIRPGKYGDGKLGEFRNKTTPVGNFPPNSFGLYDLHGNLREWCQDRWHKNYQGAPSDGSAWLSDRDDSRILRGGSWLDAPNRCRCASRYYKSLNDRSKAIGFRVVCEI
jgi:eukaryotic-like serine/threonine-protein kinase